MISHLIHIDHQSGESLQSQIRRNMVESILVGSFLPQSKLPSSRKLAQQLNVSRNTVVLVYQSLLDEGYIVSKERSGIFVSDKILQAELKSPKQTLLNDSASAQMSYNHRFKGALATTNTTSSPANWQKYAYPFIDGKYDPSLYEGFA